MRELVRPIRNVESIPTPADRISVSICMGAPKSLRLGVRSPTGAGAKLHNGPALSYARFRQAPRRQHPPNPPRCQLPHPNSRSILEARHALPARRRPRLRLNRGRNFPVGAPVHPCRDRRGCSDRKGGTLPNKPTCPFPRWTPRRNPPAAARPLKRRPWWTGRRLNRPLPPSFPARRRRRDVV